MTLDHARKIGLLQAHHWEASQWYLELSASRCPEVETIRRECCSCDDFGLSAFALLNRAVIWRLPFQETPQVIGVLREALNAVWRIREKH